MNMLIMAVFAALAWVGHAFAATIPATPRDYRAKLSTLRAGDTLVLAAGLYRNGLPLHDLHGEPTKPISIVGTSAGPATVFRGRPGANTISIKNASHLIVRSLVLDGAGQFVDAVKAEGASGFAHDITLERLTIVNHGAHQQIVGISTKCPAWGWVIRDNVILGAGTGLYLGNSDGSAPFFAGVIEGNVIVDTIGYNMEIKHQRARPAVHDMPIDPSVTIIRNNVFVKTRNASAGQLARPNLLVGHFPVQGSGKDDRYVITGNVFFENPSEALFQGEGNFQLERNLFFTTTGDAVVVQPHHDVPRQVTIAGNFVAAAGRGIRVTGGDPGSDQDVVGNQVYAPDPIRGGRRRDNVTGPYDEAGAALALAVRRGAVLDRDSIDVLAGRACSAAFAGKPGVGSASPPKTERRPVCDFLRGLGNVAAK